MNCPTGRASHSGQDLSSRLAGFRSRSYGTIYSYTPGLCACSSVLVLFRCSLFSPGASRAAAWRTSMSQQREPKVIPMCDKLSDPPYLLAPCAAYIYSVCSPAHFDPFRHSFSTRRVTDPSQSPFDYQAHRRCTLLLINKLLLLGLLPFLPLLLRLQVLLNSYNQPRTAAAAIVIVHLQGL